MDIREIVSDLPLSAKIAAVAACLIVVGGLLVCAAYYIQSWTAESAKASLTGQCIDMAEGMTAEIRSVVERQREQMAEVVQTDGTGNRSVVFVPIKHLEDRVKPCL